LYSAFFKFMYFSQYCLEMPPTAATYIITSCIQYINNKVGRYSGWRLKTIRCSNMQEKNWFISVLVFKLYGPLLYMPFFTKINIFSGCLCNTLHWYCSGLQRYIRSIIFTQLAILINFFSSSNSKEWNRMHSLKKHWNGVLGTQILPLNKYGYTVTKTNSLFHFFLNFYIFLNIHFHEWVIFTFYKCVIIQHLKAVVSKNVLKWTE